MTLVLELPETVEKEVREAAKESGAAPDVWLLLLAERELKRRREAQTTSARKDAAARGLGMFAGRGRSVDEFLADRRAEAEAEMTARDADTRDAAP